MRASRGQRILIGLALGLVSLVVANVLAYPRFFGTGVSFKWSAKTGISEAYVEFPPEAKVPAFWRLIGRAIAWEARPFISAYLRKLGWEVAEGRFLVFSIPFPPIVTDLNHIGHSTLIDPKVTPLMHAADAGDLESVKTLLSSGADVNARDQLGWTALMHGSESIKASAQVVQTLIYAGADVNTKDTVGRTALTWAPLSGSDGPGKVRALLAAHADPNVRSNFGETPLGRAFAAPSPDGADMVAQLLAAGADPNTKLLDGTALLSRAQEDGNTEMVRLLKRFGARE
jgi:Ankyrin repeats (3 copies)